MTNTLALLRPAIAGLLLILPAVYATAAHAQLTFTLEAPTQTSLPGQTLSFAGTIQNVGTQELFLNGDSFTLNGTGLTLDDTDFFTNAPLSLLASETFTGTFFTVVIDQNAPIIGGNTGTFTIQGGATDQTFNNLATANFQVDVGPAASAAPEPGSSTLLLPALGIAGFVMKRRKK